MAIVRCKCHAVIGGSNWIGSTNAFANHLPNANMQRCPFSGDVAPIAQPRGCNAQNGATVTAPMYSSETCDVARRALTRLAEPLSGGALRSRARASAQSRGRAAAPACGSKLVHFAWASQRLLRAAQRGHVPVGAPLQEWVQECKWVQRCMLLQRWR